MIDLKIVGSNLSPVPLGWVLEQVVVNSWREMDHVTVCFEASVWTSDRMMLIHYDSPVAYLQTFPSIEKKGG